MAPVDDGAPLRSAGLIRRIVGVAAAAALLASTAVWFRVSNADRAVARASARALVADPRGLAAAAGSSDAARAELRRAPLDQAAFNVVYVLGARSSDAERNRAVLERLGWRSTAAQQNLIAAAAERRSIPAILDRVDGLLRRNQLVDALAPVLAALERSDEGRGLLAAKLFTNPSWRELFLIRGGELRGAAALRARAATMAALLDRGGTLTRAELSAPLTTMVVGGEGEAAHRLWSRSIGGVRPGDLLHDGDFRRAAADGVRPELPIPFEWRFDFGDGFSSTVDGEGALAIRWTGRGVPVFVSQAVRTPRGAALDLLVDYADAGVARAAAERLDFSMTCPDGAVLPFQVVARGRTSARLRVAAPGCAVPTLVLSGRLGEGNVAPLLIRRMRLVPAARA